MTFIKLLNKIVTKHNAAKESGISPKKIMLGTDEMDMFIHSLGDTVVEWDKHDMLKGTVLLGCKVGVWTKKGVTVL